MNKKNVAIIMAGGSGMGSDAAKKLATNGYRVSILSSSGKDSKMIFFRSIFPPI